MKFAAKFSIFGLICIFAVAVAITSFLKSSKSRTPEIIARNLFPEDAYVHDMGKNGELMSIKSKDSANGMLAASVLNDNYEYGEINKSIDSLVEWNSKSIEQFSGGKSSTRDKFELGNTYFKFASVKSGKNEEIAVVFALNVKHKIWIGQFLGSQNDWDLFVGKVKNVADPKVQNGRGRSLDFHE